MSFAGLLLVLQPLPVLKSPEEILEEWIGFSAGAASFKQEATRFIIIFYRRLFSGGSFFWWMAPGIAGLLCGVKHGERVCLIKQDRKLVIEAGARHRRNLTEF